MAEKKKQLAGQLYGCDREFSMSVVTDLEQVQVRFTTQQQKYAITESAIFVPANFKRYGLSGIVNHLLGNGMLRTILCRRLFSFLTLCSRETCAVRFSH
jgi:hypothetical protein